MNSENKSEKKRVRKRIIIIIAAVAICVVAALWGYKEYARTHVSTDDAYVDGRIHVIAPKINGTVEAVCVVDNEFVKKGTLLLEIDAVDYNVRVDETNAAFSAEKSRLSEMDARSAMAKSQLEEVGHQAEAARVNLDVQRKNLAQAELEIGKAQANLDVQEARLRQSDQDIKRANNLFGQDAMSQEKYENVRTAKEVAVAQVKAAREQLNQARVALDAQAGRVLQSEIEIKRITAAQTTQKNMVRQTAKGVQSQSAIMKQREAMLRTAELNRGYTKIYAPVDGYVSKRSVEKGNQIQAGQPLLAVVPIEGTWITANLKETQLERVRPGQKVRIRVDSYSDKIFIGKVDSVMAGTGSAFALFPPENATGNFVKVVQRVPVKIILDKDADPDHLLRVGLSVIPTILTE